MSEPYSHNIALRMKDCLERQIVWFRSLKNILLNASESMITDDDIDEAKLVDLAEQMDAANKENRVLEDEFNALKREWDQTETILPQARDEIKMLAHDAQALSVELTNLYTKNNELATRLATAKRVEMATMQRLSSAMRKYRSPDDDHDTLFDKNG